MAPPWTVACQTPVSMGFSRQEYWSGLPFSSPGDLSDPGIEPGSPALQVDALPSELLGRNPGVTSDKLKLKDRLQNNGPDSFLREITRLYLNNWENISLNCL